ncbi:DUF5937 family protein [Agrococcus sp. HG114]|uniref:ArsR/SmtB family transcription factor n=1 Tax=Agrococcus sp. HG114 TaxID=2969757 RepID=UPI00215AE491|nr:DUF5937 family protein [Agrococcus sp. HG114]MCR8669570.1 DUF5937 family protein [Agrococcus sp. HG114]
MPIVFDVAEVRADDVVIAPSELAELMALLHVLAEPDHHRDRRRETDRIVAAIPANLLRQLRVHAPLWARFRLRAFLPLQAAGGGLSFDSSLDAVRALPLTAFFEMAAETVAGGRLPDHQQPSRDEAAFLEHCRSKSDERESLARRLLRDPAAFRDQVVDIAARCHDRFFAEVWAGIEPALQQRADLQREQLALEPVGELLASLAPDAHLFGQREHVVFDKLQSAVVPGAGREFVLIPSVWSDPHLLIKYDAAYASVPMPVIVQYPVRRPVASGLSLRTVQERLAVLSDESRQELCRHLVNEWCTTSELARRTGMTAPQVSRHLRRLKDVDLLVSTRNGKLVAHRLRSERIYQLGYEFLSTLTR